MCIKKLVDKLLVVHREFDQKKKKRTPFLNDNASCKVFLRGETTADYAEYAAILFEGGTCDTVVHYH